MVNTEGGTIIESVKSEANPDNEGENEIHFYKDFAASIKQAAATQGVFRDKIKIVWRPFRNTDGALAEEYIIQRMGPTGKFEKYFSVKKETSFDDTDNSIKNNAHYEYRIFALCKPLPHKPADMQTELTNRLSSQLQQLQKVNLPDRPGLEFKPHALFGVTGSKAR